MADALHILVALLLASSSKVMTTDSPLQTYNRVLEKVIPEMRARAELVEELNAKLDRAKTEQDVIEAAYLVRLHRCAECIPSLVRHLGFKTDAVVTTGVPHWSERPIVDALRACGWQSVPRVMHRLEATRNPEVAAQCIGVVVDVYGKRLAEVFLQDYLNSLADRDAQVRLADWWDRFGIPSGVGRGESLHLPATK